MNFTLLIIIATVLASFYAWENSEIYRRWMLNPASVYKRREYFRFITSGLIHSNYTHLIFNMITLYFFGRVVEHIYQIILGDYGSFAFVLFYFAAIVISDIPTYIKHKENYAYNSLGASGGVTAVVFAGILFNPTMPVGLLFVPVQFPGFFFAIAYMMYSAYMTKNSNDYINHDAHLYGALFGIAFSIVIYPRVVFSFAEQIANWQGFF